MLRYLLGSQMKLATLLMQEGNAESFRLAVEHK
jgi:hypothetical protein